MRIHKAITGLVGMVVWVGVQAHAQDEPWRALRINEVIADNDTRPPVDFGDSYVDMVEIYNTGDVKIVLGQPDNLQSIALSDTAFIPGEVPEQPDETLLWKFRNRVEVSPGSAVLVFCDGNAEQDRCEPHANFRISSSGEEALTLWGPADPVTGDRPIIDQVWLPPLPEDVSFGRFPDGAGDAPVPIESVFDNFVFNPPGTSTFGTCVKITASTTCPGGRIRVCGGAENGPGGNLAPRVELDVHSTNSPAAGEPVSLIVHVEDDKEPTPPNIALVQVLYRVDGGPVQTVDLDYDAATGVVYDEVTIRDDITGEITFQFPSPFFRWTLWTGEIPGQPAGAVVEFHLRVVDVEGLEDTSPGTLCENLTDPTDPNREPPEGPCDRQFGGPGCWRDETDVACDGGGSDDEEEEGAQGAGADAVVGLRYIECSRWFQYVSGYEPPAPLANLVISEVVASQGLVGEGGNIEGVLEDPTEADRQCDIDNPTCKYDDFIELHNFGDEVIDISGICVSDSRFNPRKWTFPDGSLISPGQYLIVWLDNDGGQCPCLDPDLSTIDAPYCDPDLTAEQQPCFWECPDPTNPCAGEYHASISINADRDQVYLYDVPARNYGRIHGVEFDDPAVYPDGIPTNQSLSLIPDNQRDGTWQITADPTPACPNEGPCPEPPNRLFYRGDSNSDCGIDITDGVYILNYLFLGGPKPTCLDAADANDTGAVDITDGIFVLGYLFLGSTAPPPPQPPALNPGGPGEDPTCDTLAPCVAPLCQ